MQVYSKKIIQFIHEIKQIVKNILENEIQLKVSRSRFYDKQGRYSYPIKVVIFNNKPMLGYFNSEFFELGFHETLMRSSKDQLQDIIRHELAHYITFTTYGSSIQSHGIEFQAFCKSMGWEKNVSAATTCLDDAVTSFQTEENSILRKIQKLMALSRSQNEHEAELAMIKSQQLLLKHHIDAKDINQDDEEKIFLKRILKQNREDAKMRTIARILETFFVNCVYSKSSGHIYLEIVGNAVNVEIAEYVADFLSLELDNLWDQTRKKHRELKGLVAKNSFFQGLAKGYCDKIQFLKKEYQGNAVNALMVIEKQLIEAKEMVYPRLSHSKSRGSYSHDAAMLGAQMGKSLNIRPGVGNTAQHSGTCLTYQTR